ncbi:cytochrome c biogenesis protein CcdA [Fictibacillus sp. S7]|uniref:HoxN/HupN/NixA family nickel/cobalt transporter n=1 Tax=Fictibacillus sp. S7 TaxID=2212476 RepID=UPI0010109C74|nr:cytochrome c biogenesis protein CcdA [Fictibacillus sp. S7]RXY99872.1 High-affinity nickel-transporter [Fictibacillus sp. S7]
MELMTFAVLAIFIGMRHGLDGDHVAAIADMVGSERRRKRQLTLGVMYALGHGAIVFLIGLLSIYVGAKLPEGAQSYLELAVSVTLIILGLIIILSIFQRKKDYEYKSRLMIVMDYIRKLTGSKKETSDLTKFGIISAFIIGVIHGIGVESPTQIAAVTQAAGLGSVTGATMQLVLFVIGLLASTICVTFLFTWGFMKASMKKGFYIVLGSVTGVYSVGLGLYMMAELLKGGF